MIDYRETQPCARCAHNGADCEFVRRELASAARHLNDVAVLAGRRLADMELLLACRSFSPRHSKETPYVHA